MSSSGFPAKERLRFRKLLEVAHSTTYVGEREAALGAAARLAKTYGMSLREAAGMPDAPKEKPKAKIKRPRGFRADFGAAGPDSMGMWWVPKGTRFEDSRHLHRTSLEADKERREQALKDAISRGLDADENAQKSQSSRNSGQRRKSNNRAWRPRAEFVRVLLAETRMSAKEIAAVAGVTIYDVFREKLLMRRA